MLRRFHGCLPDVLRYAMPPDDDALICAAIVYCLHLLRYCRRRFLAHGLYDRFAAAMPRAPVASEHHMMPLFDLRFSTRFTHTLPLTQALAV